MFHTPAHKNVATPPAQTLGDLIKEEQHKIEQEKKTLGQLLEDAYFDTYKDGAEFPTGSSEAVADALFWQILAERFLKEVAKRSA